MDSPTRGNAINAVTEIATALDWPIPNAQTRARILERYELEGPPPWPKPRGKGGGKNVAVATNWHCNNLLLSIATADPTTTAQAGPQFVLSYRRIPVLDRGGWGATGTIDPENPDDVTKGILAWARTLSPSYGEGDARYRAIPGETLGEALDNLVDWISRPEGMLVRQNFRACGMWVDLGVGYAFPNCRIGYARADNIRVQSSYQNIGGAWPIVKDPVRPPGMTTTNRVHFSVFETLADIWADSRPRIVGMSNVPFSPPDDATVESEKKTPGPRHRAPASKRTKSMLKSNNQPREPEAENAHSSENNSALVATQARSGPQGFRKEPSCYELPA